MLLLLPRRPGDLPQAPSFLEQSAPVPAASTLSIRAADTALIGRDGWSIRKRSTGATQAEAIGGAPCVYRLLPQKLRHLRPGLQFPSSAFKVVAHPAREAYASMTHGPATTPRRGGGARHSRHRILLDRGPGRARSNQSQTPKATRSIWSVRLGAIAGAENTRPAAATGLACRRSSGTGSLELAQNCRAALAAHVGCVGVMAARSKEIPKGWANIWRPPISCAQLASVGPPPNRGADTRSRPPTLNLRAPMRWRGSHLLCYLAAFSVSDFLCPSSPRLNSSPSSREARVLSPTVKGSSLNPFRVVMTSPAFTPP